MLMLFSALPEYSLLLLFSKSNWNYALFWLTSFLLICVAREKVKKIRKKKKDSAKSGDRNAGWFRDINQNVTPVQLYPLTQNEHQSVLLHNCSCGTSSILLKGVSIFIFCNCFPYLYKWSEPLIWIFNIVDLCNLSLI